MLSPRQARRAFIPLAALVMSGVISLVMTMFEIGLEPALLFSWLRRWPLAFAVALPAAWVVLPTLQSLLSRFTHRPDDTATVPRAGRSAGRLG